MPNWNTDSVIRALKVVGFKRPGDPLAPLLPLIVRLVSGFLAGTFMVQWLPVLPPWWLAPPVLLVLVFCWHLRFFLVAAVLGGFAWASIHGGLRLAERLAEEGRQQVLVEGQIVSLPDELDRGFSFEFAIQKVLEPPGLRVPGHVKVSWYDADRKPESGDLWRFNLSLRRPRGTLNPGGFDLEQWQFAEGIRGVGYVRNSPSNQRLTEVGTALLSPLRWRQLLSDRIQKALSGSSTAGMIEALTLGADHHISKEQWEVLRKTGTTHLIAISGSHIGLIAGSVFIFLRILFAWLGIQRCSPQTLAALLAGVTAIFYSALAGFSIPTQRAMIMIMLAMGAIVLRRNVNATHMLCLTLLAVIVYDPLSVLSPGFWLSFGAVLLIAYVIAGRTTRVEGFTALWKINWVTALGLAPLLLLFFGQVSLVSPLANLLAVPVLGMVLVPVCLVAALFLPIVPVIGTWLFHVADTILAWFWPILVWLAHLPLAMWSHAVPPSYALLLAFAGVLLLLAPIGIPSRWLGFILLLPALTFHPERLPPGAFRVILLDVGQGLAVAVETRHRTLIYDTGAKLGPNFDMGSAVIEPYLLQKGISLIDTLVISHADNDHIGGAESVLQRFPVDHVYTSAPAQLADYHPVSCGADQVWNWDGVEFRMLAPMQSSQKENDNSCVLRIAGGGGSALLTGDIETTGESLLVDRYGPDLRSDLLVAPHHGSKTSSTRRFLEVVKPGFILIPVGYLNRFGFPNPKVLERYAEFGSHVMDSVHHGAITVTFEKPGGIPRLESYRQANLRYWNEP